MLLDSDNEDDEDINSKWEAFVEVEIHWTTQFKHPFVGTL